MNLSHARFYKGDVLKRFQLFDGPKAQTYREHYLRYFYETKDAVYHVDVRVSDGAKSYHRNFGFGTEPHPIHRAIEKHYDLV
jgi:hypothetical protein